MNVPFPSRIVLTGAAGIVGTSIRPLLRERCNELLLTDVQEVDPLHAKEQFFQGDLTDLDFLTEVTADADGIVHLAGHVGANFTFDDVLGANIVGTHNLFEAARRNGVPRVVYASSHHAVGFFRRGDPIDHTTAPRPDSFYGLSKAFGEELGSYYADRHGMRVLAIRIGFVGDEVIDERRLHTWMSPRDFVQLIEIGFTHPDIRFEIVYGVSENPEPFFDNRNAHRLGYSPEDRALDHLADEEFRHLPPDTSTADGTHIGGHFTET